VLKIPSRAALSSGDSYSVRPDIDENLLREVRLLYSTSFFSLIVVVSLSFRLFVPCDVFSVELPTATPIFERDDALLSPFPAPIFSLEEPIPLL